MCVLFSPGPYNSHEELEEELHSLDSGWHLGPEDDPRWRQAVARETPNLFCVDGVESGAGTRRILYK